MDSFQGRVHVGCFGIVVEVDAVERAHEFEAVLDARKGPIAAAIWSMERPARCALTAAAMRVLDVVPAAQGNVADRQQRSPIENRFTVPSNTSLIEHARRAEPHAIARAALRIAWQIMSSAFSTAKSSSCWFRTTALSRRHSFRRCDAGRDDPA